MKFFKKKSKFYGYQNFKKMLFKEKNHLFKKQKAHLKRVYFKKISFKKLNLKYIFKKRLSHN